MSTAAQKLCRRSFSTRRSYEEVKIPMPWGHVSAKWWLPHDTKPILAVHGLQDNAGSFDRLVPHLPSRVGVLAIDLPGHGLSSKLPDGCFYHDCESTILFRRIAKYFDWDKVTLMGHSFGAAWSYVYAMIYPKDVDVLICLDGFPLIAKCQLDSIARTTEDFLKYDALNSGATKPPSYTLEQLRERTHAASNKSIDAEHADSLLERHCLPVKNKPGLFYINKDLRLKVGPFLKLPLNLVMEGVTRIQCPVFTCIGKNSYYYAIHSDFLKNVFKDIQKHNDRYYLYEVDGTHHVHLNNPERVTCLLNKFLLQYC